MIRNLKELIGYLDVKARSFPVIASEIRLLSPGLTKGEIEELTSVFPDLPDSYFEVLKKVKVENISIGYFNISPGGSNKFNFVERLSRLNSGFDNPFLDHMKVENIIEVASLEADPICVGCRNTNKGGKVYIYDHTELNNFEIKLIANSFEEMLILAGNISEVKMSFKDNMEAGVNELTRRIKEFNVPKECEEFWASQIEMAI